MDEFDDWIGLTGWRLARAALAVRGTERVVPLAEVLAREDAPSPLTYAELARAAESLGLAPWPSRPGVRAAPRAAEEHRELAGVLLEAAREGESLEFVELAEVERGLVGHVFLALARSSAAALALVDSRLALWPHEGDGLLALARAEAVRRFSSASAEEVRAILAARLEALALRAESVFDFKTQLGALKALGVVHGVSRIEPQDADAMLAASFREAIRTSLARPPAPRVVEAHARVLPPPQAGVENSSANAAPNGGTGGP